MIRDTLSKLKAWFSSEGTIDAAKPVGKDRKQTGPTHVRPAESAKKAKRRAQRQARCLIPRFDGAILSLEWK
ncbi:hypothetical protein QCD71_20470, partial [Sphingomonas sp. PsM26]|nr:hypothetical protein [Sphingomonas sp. PsM26]